MDYMLSYRAPERNIFRFSGYELTPTLEEWSRFFGLSLIGSCAQISIGTYATSSSQISGYSNQRGVGWACCFDRVLIGVFLFFRWLFCLSDSFPYIREGVA